MAKSTDIRNAVFASLLGLTPTIATDVIKTRETKLSGDLPLIRVFRGDESVELTSLHEHERELVITVDYFDHIDVDTDDRIDSAVEHIQTEITQSIELSDLVDDVQPSEIRFTEVGEGDQVAVVSVDFIINYTTEV